MIRLRLVTHVGAGSGLQPFVVGSLALHVIFVVAVILVSTLRSDRAISDDFVVVTLLPAAAPGAQTPAVTAPAPESTTPPEGVVARPEEPPKPKPIEKPKPEKTEPDPPPRPTPTAAPPTQPEETSGPSDEGGPAEVGIAGLEGDEFAWYRMRVKNAIQVKWRRPFLQGIRDSIEVSVVFVIQRDGSVTGLAIDVPSGVAALDRSAQRAVYEAALPALPRNWDEPTADARFVFRLFPEEF